MLPRYDPALLRRLSSRMQADAQRFSSHAPARDTPDTSPCYLSLDALNLHVPPSLTPKLIALGVERSIARRVSSVMKNASSRFKADCEADFRRKLPTFNAQLQSTRDVKLLTAIPLTYTTIYDMAIRNHTTYLLNDVAPRILRAQNLRLRASSPHAKKPFNYVRPLLLS